MSDNQPLSQLAASLMAQDMTPSPSPARRSLAKAEHKHEEGCVGWWAFVFYFLVFALVYYFVFFALRPSFVLNGDDKSYSRSSYSDDDDREISNGKLLGSAIVASLITIFVFWIFWWAFRA